MPEARASMAQFNKGRHLFAIVTMTATACLMTIGVILLLRTSDDLSDTPQPESPQQQWNSAAMSDSDCDELKLVAQSKPPLVVSSWNINFGNNNLQEVADRLMTTNADVICLQETTPTSEAFLATELRPLYGNILALGHRGDWMAERFMILSRHRILSAHFVEPPRNFFGHVVAQVEIDGQAVTIIGVHLTPFSTRGAANAIQALMAISETETDHQIEIEAVIQDIVPTEATVVVGDFNSLSHFVAPQALSKEMLQDAFAQVHSNPDQLHRTWRWPLGRTGELNLRIDYIFHSRHFKASKAVISACSCSDHDLLTAELMWQD